MAATSQKTEATKNQAPVIQQRQLSVTTGKKLYIQLTFSDTDGPGPYSYTIVKGPAQGTLSGDNNDRYYVPKTGFVGRDEFTWKVNDGQADSNAATVVLTVKPADANAANDAASAKRRATIFRRLNHREAGGSSINPMTSV